MFLYHALLDGLKTGNLAYPLSQYLEVYKRLCGDVDVTELAEQFKVMLLLLLACAITHHSYVQSIVLEPCSRLIVQSNEAIDPLRWSVDGATSTGDVVCRLFSTALTAVVRGQSPAQHVSPKSANTSP